ncbi:hypothetical protein CABS01_16841 [Colletotrichum abscissum]|uniref:uncharacterized protein n=1 Tax=Colletotrichum abscissum TaxID=1671311 RepID=UPI0027D65321|nr:uncharacterized protein CABS01_16841 [Colletotrichum abscissum]KAK1509309.1 hypothetical protein CABS01_16841 [Colletotrichum abscissum]
MQSSLATTPATSRSQNSTRLTSVPTQVMELMLVGIGEHIQTLPSGGSTANLLVLSREPSLPEFRLSRDGLSTPTRINTAAETSNSSQEADADSDNLCHSDDDLDRATGLALSHCSGVDLDQLDCSICIIDTSTKRHDQGVESLHEEELFSTIDWDDDGFSCYDVEQGHASNSSSALDETLIVNLDNQSQGQRSDQPKNKV